MLIYLQVIDAPEDRDQFITLYETYRGLMFYVANQILQNEQDAEDAVHDAFLSVAEHIKKFSRLERHKTKAFLVTIVENKAIDLYRKKTHRKEEILWEETTGLAPRLRTGGRADPVHFEAARPVPGISPFETRAGLLHQGGG